MMGFDFSPDVNEQAEDRLRRKSSTHKHFNVWYMIHEDSYDLEIWDMLNTKTRDVNAVLRAPKRLLDIMALKDIT